MIVPPTVAPSVGLVICTTGGGGVVTVTLRVAIAVRPAPSWTVRFSVCAPLGMLLEFQPNDAVVAAPELEKIGAPPSTESVKLIGVPLAPFAAIPTVTMPLTVAPSAGLVNEAVSVAGPCVTTVRFALPVLFTASRTLTVAVCVPPEAPAVFHGIEIGPFDVVFVVTTAAPSMLSVRLRVPAAAFSSQIVNHTVPLTVVPSVLG